MKKTLFLVFLMAFCVFTSLSQAAPAPPQMSYSVTWLNLAVNWTAVPDATGYMLYYAPYPYTGEDSIDSINVGNTNSFSADLWDGAAYYIAVSSYDSLGESTYSNVEQFTIGDGSQNAPSFSNPTLINNNYLPMISGTTSLYQAETEDGVETIVVEVLDETRVVAGVECVVVRDRVYLDELLIEDTHDWFAQDDDGNIWYAGEEVVNYEYDDDDNILETNNEGAWEAGVDGAQPGILIKAMPTVGDVYQQEFYPGEAEDMAEVIALNVAVTLSDGTMHNCLKTLEWNPLEEDSEEYKYYAPGLGLVKEEDVEGEEAVELKGTFLTNTDDSLPSPAATTFTNTTVIDNPYLPLLPGTTYTYELETEDGVETIVVEVLNETKEILGVETVVVRDRAYLDGLLIEDTYDWFVQDDDGNVWYVGEEVVNYEYDDEDNLIETNDDGSWETGVDGALPGIVMWANPVVGTSYYQEYLEDEAVDMGYVVATGVEVELSDETIYENCVQTLDWTSQEPFVMEYKYYAPNVGLILEEHVGGDESAELVSTE